MTKTVLFGEIWAIPSEKLNSKDFTTINCAWVEYTSPEEQEAKDNAWTGRQLKLVGKELSQAHTEERQ